MLRRALGHNINGALKAPPCVRFYLNFFRLLGGLRHGTAALLEIGRFDRTNTDQYLCERNSRAATT